mgnify:FL=1
MKITVTPEALAWFQAEVEVPTGQGVRFFGKVYGKTQVHDGFSVGMTIDTPEKPIVETKEAGILFFAEEADDWFFKGYDLVVAYDEKLEEPKYEFTENGEEREKGL